MRGLRILLLSTLLFVPGLLQAAPGQFSISADALGQWAFSPSSVSSTPAAGFLLFADYRPTILPFLSLGLQLGAAEYFKGSGFQTTWVDLAGRIFPTEETTLGQFYLQGGFGMTPLRTVLPNHWQGRFHGNAGAGYSFTTASNQALDVGVQYDVFSPRAQTLDNVGVKVGYTWFIGSVEQPDRALIKMKAILYTWKKGDSLEALALRYYGDSGLYPLIVDANGDLVHPYDLQPGIRIRIPQMPPQELFPSIREKGLQAAYRQWTVNGVKIPLVKTYLNLPKRAVYHTWKAGDNLKDLADKYYGEENLYPLIVDANEKRLIHPVNMRKGALIVIPVPPAEDKLGAVEDRAMNDKYIWWFNVSQRQ